MLINRVTPVTIREREWVKRKYGTFNRRNAMKQPKLWLYHCTKLFEIYLSGQCKKSLISFEKYTIFFFFLLDFGLSRLTSLQFIQYHAAGFYKPTIPQSPPSHLQDYSICNNARLEFFHNFCSKLWSKWMVPEKWSP